MCRLHDYVLPIILAMIAAPCAMAADTGVTTLACRLNAPDARHAGSGCSTAWFDANLRINEIQVVGTAESYKLRPTDMSLIHMGSKKDSDALDFAMPPLTAQLDGDARALQFDVAFDPNGGLFKSPAGASMAMDLLENDYIAAMEKPGFKVLHVLDVDYRSSCLAFSDCLKQVAAWSHRNPRHVPIVITIHSNDARTPMPGATHPLPFNTAAFDALDGEIRAAFAPDEIITPDKVQGHHATLREAVLAHEWPKLGTARGKVLFVLDDTPDKIALYRGARTSLEGRAMFVATDETSPAASFITINDPQKDAQRIAADVKLGFMVQTRADDGTVEARSGNTARRDQAFASGAQVVATNFLMPDKAIGPYQVRLKDGHRAACNIRNAPERCAGWGLELGIPPATVLTAATH